MATNIQVEVTLKKEALIDSPTTIEKEFLKDIFGNVTTIKVMASKITLTGVTITTPDHEFYHPSDFKVPLEAILSHLSKKRGEGWSTSPAISTLASSSYHIVKDVESDDCPECGSSMPTPMHGLCPTCFTKKHYHINSYSHKPTADFVKVAGEEPSHYYGMEIEVSVDDKLAWAKYHAEQQDKVYFKSDSTIPSGSEGSLELVTHPHSFKALMSDESFVNNMPATSNGAGCHVHISRTAFENDTHFSLWYFLMLKSNKLLNTVARREETGYCKRTAYGEISTKDNNKKSGQDRAVAINERLDHTVEVRIFNWSTDPKILRSYVQFIDSMIEYTRNKSRTATVTAWKKFISTKAEYADVYDVVKDITFPKGTGVSRVTPIYREITVNSLTMRHLNKGALYKYDGEWRKVLTIDCRREDRLVLDGYGDVRVTSSDIVKVRTN